MMLLKIQQLLFAVEAALIRGDEGTAMRQLHTAQRDLATARLLQHSWNLPAKSCTDELPGETGAN